jgi:ABC-type antimicrobial peptide transport system permease subunit
MLAHSDQIEIYALPICKYLRTNLQLGIQVIETVCLLPLIHEYASPLAKKQITACLHDKYPTNICYFHQITTLSSINLTLVEPFVWLMRGLRRWFIKEAEEKDYNSIE